MTNPIISTDIGDILKELASDQKKILMEIGDLKLGQAKLEGKVEALDERLSGQIKSLDERLSGQIKSLDERLSGQIKSLDEKLSGQIKALDTKTEQLDKRIGNSELTNRGILIGLIVAILGGLAKLFGLFEKSGVQ
jgi:DNA repair exonuclease SbcCD ATPase subunit